MTTAWKLSISKLNEQLPEAVDLLRCCAFFGAEPIPLDLFNHTIQGVQPQLGDLLAKPTLLSKAINELGRVALAQIDSVSRTIQVTGSSRRCSMRSCRRSNRVSFGTTSICYLLRPRRKTQTTMPNGRFMPSWRHTYFSRG
jgi:hypothetical protein